MMRKRMVRVLILAFLLVSCGGGNDADGSGVYLPPTQVGGQPVSTLVLPTQVIAVMPLSTPQGSCVNNLYWLEDLTVPDGSSFTPGATIDKQWLVQNNGDCNWDNHYRLQLVAGVAMGVPEVQALYPAHAGAQAVIRISFTAPSELGTYRSEWQAFDPQGLPFGDPIFIEILVSP